MPGHQDLDVAGRFHRGYETAHPKFFETTSENLGRGECNANLRVGKRTDELDDQFPSDIFQCTSILNIHPHPYNFPGSHWRDRSPSCKVHIKTHAASLEKKRYDFGEANSPVCQSVDGLLWTFVIFPF